jgi:phospholipase C
MDQPISGAAAAAFSLAFLAAAPCAASGQAASYQPASYPEAKAHIEHVIIIMQENRSFDNYFGTYPGADGIPPGVCLPLTDGSCVQPFHDVHDVNTAGGHGPRFAQADLDDGITTDKMDGFAEMQEEFRKDVKRCPQPDGHKCDAATNGLFIHDVMGYHTASEIPNYWAYAQHFVLQDRLFAGTRSWSMPSHLDLTSEWVAECTDYTKAISCYTSPLSPNLIKLNQNTTLPWVNMFQLLDVHNVTWKYYLGQGTEPDCEDDEMDCVPQTQTGNVASIWNPAPYFAWVQSQGANYLTAHNPPIEQFIQDVQGGTLPQVSWIVPTGKFSEHAPSGITAGMEYVTSLVNAVMASPTYWNNTAIFITWDEWGGLYDHVAPPNVDTNNSAYPEQGYGLRVPGLMISAWARAGLIDHSLHSFDSYARFVENLFAGSARLDPNQLGNPDNRPDIRDKITKVTFVDGHTENVGDLLEDFDFRQKPLPTLVLSTHIPTAITIRCNRNPHNTSSYCRLKNVSISWDPVTGPKVPGPFTYHVLRDGTELTQCIGEGTGCVDKPGSGHHVYQAYSVDTNGTASPLSAGAEADEP